MFPSFVLLIKSGLIGRFDIHKPILERMHFDWGKKCEIKYMDNSRPDTI